MEFTGILIGLVVFVTIGVFHPVVVKAEYYFSKKIWPLFAGAGAFFLLLSLWVEAVFFSAVSAVIGMSFLWSIRELFEQEKRVEKGWFPMNPNRKNCVRKGRKLQKEGREK